jgi:hypothetical protein
LEVCTMGRKLTSHDHLAFLSGRLRLWGDCLGDDLAAALSFQKS